MFLEKIEEQLLEEIQDALDEEHDEIVANWDEEIIDLENEDFDDTLRTEIFGDYLDIPLNLLADMINQHIPLIKEKEISIHPFAKVMTSENDDNKEVLLQLRADVFHFVRETLSETESKQLDKLLGELTQLYEDLEIDTTLYLTQIPIEDVPEEYYDEEDDYDFVQIEF